MVSIVGGLWTILGSLVVHISKDGTGKLSKTILNTCSQQMEPQKQNGQNGMIPQQTCPQIASRISTILEGPDEVLMADNNGKQTTVSAVVQ